MAQGKITLLPSHAHNTLAATDTYMLHIRMWVTPMPHTCLKDEGGAH